MTATLQAAPTDLAAPTFPPLFTGEAVADGADPFAAAKVRAVAGCDAGLLVHSVQADRLRAAIVFAPEVPLGEAMVALPVCGIGFQNALGALAPPEVAVHLAWNGGVLVNGARCGRLRVAAASSDPDAVPDWLIVGLDLAVIAMGSAPGTMPERTVLYDEGCGDVIPAVLLEAWARHTLVWLHRWLDDGAAPIHKAWCGLAAGLDAPASQGGVSGTFIGVDERFAMLLRDGKQVHMCPLGDLLET